MSFSENSLITITDNDGIVSIKNSIFKDIKQNLLNEWQPQTPFPLISITNCNQEIIFSNTSFERISTSTENK